MVPQQEIDHGDNKTSTPASGESFSVFTSFSFLFFHLPLSPLFSVYVNSVFFSPDASAPFL